MHGGAGRDAHEDAPHDKRPPTEPKEDQRDRKLLQHPAAIEKPVERIVANSWAGIETRRMLQDEPAMEIKQAIEPEAFPVREERMTIGLALRPIPAVVHANGPQRPTHAHRRS